MAAIDNLQSYVRRTGAPVALGLIASWVAVSLFYFFFKPAWFGELMAGPDVFQKPWTLLTYGFAYPGLVGGFGLLGLIFTCFWMLFAGASVEREVGSIRFLIAWFAFQVTAGLAIGIGTQFLTRGGIVLSAPYLPLAAVTVAWGVRNPTTPIMLYGILPLNGKLLAWLTAGFVFFGYGFPVPIIGALACLHLGLAVLFATDRIPQFPYRLTVYRSKPSKAQREREEHFAEEVRKRRQDREERERLRKLFESSLNDDDAR